MCIASCFIDRVKVQRNMNYLLNYCTLFLSGALAQRQPIILEKSQLLLLEWKSKKAHKLRSILRPSEGSKNYRKVCQFKLMRHRSQYPSALIFNA